MNTILITGSCDVTDIKIKYDVFIWASLAGQPIQMITARHIETEVGYNDLWPVAKDIVTAYFDTNQFYDGAYTQYLDHLIKVSK